MKEKNWTNLTKRNHRYFTKGERAILVDYAYYDYKLDGWVFAPDSYFSSVINSNDADEISEKEAREIVEKNGGTNFDKQDKLIIE